MKKLRILIDMDEVLNNLLEKWVECLNDRYNTHSSAEDIHLWDLRCIYPFLSEAEVNRPLSEDAFWQGLRTKPYAVDTVKAMIGDGHEIFIVTAASVIQTLPAKIEWLLANYPCITWENVIITRRKQVISGDVLIDDAVHNLENGDYYKILMDCPNNRAYDAGRNGMVRVYSLKEAYEHIKKTLLR
jgi:5'(3')-deoxyribonucleotidase